MMTILVLDDEEKLRQNLAKHLRKRPDVDNVLDFSSGDELVRSLGDLAPFPKIFILDINMPGEINGIGALKVIKEQYPEAKVFMFTSSEDEAEHARCRSLGAEDVVVKPMGRIALKAALTGIMEGS